MFTAQLKELFAARTEHEAGDLSTVRYFERILAAGTEHGVTLSGYKNLGLLRRLVRDESKIDEARLAAEQTEVIGAISAEDQRELGQPDSGLSPVGVLAYWQSARERGALINKGSQLEQYLKYLRRCRKLDAAEVSGELSHLEKTIFNALARSEDARTLLEIIRRFETLRHLLTLQAVPDDFAAYQANRSAYDSARLTAFLNARIHALGRYYDKAVFLDEDFEQAEKNAAAFYQISARRDSAMVSNLVDRMNAADEKQAVLVAGGFHAPGLERELRTRGISYLLVIPAVTHPTDTALYEKRLLAQKAFFRSPSTPTVAALAERAGSEPAKKSLMLRPLSAAARMHDADAIESLNELGISRPDYPAVVSEAPAVAQPANLNPIVSHALDMPVSDHVRELLKSWLYPGKAFGARLAADSKAAGGRTDVLRVIMVSTALVYAAYAVAGIVGGLTAAAAVSAWRGSAGLRLGRIKTAIFALALSAVFLLGALDSRVQELSDFIQLRHLSVEQRRNLMDRYLRIAVENELAYDLFGAPLFGAEHKAAVTSLRLFFAETETSNRHIDQEGGEAVYPEQLEPDTIKTVLIRMFRDDADGHLVSALLQNLQTSGRIDSDFADELQSLSRRVLQERVSKQHDATVMTDLMQWIHPKLEGTDAGKWNRRQKDFHNLMFHLNLYYEMKTKGLALPDAEDAAAMIHFYKLVWRPGKTILPRLRLKLWKLKPLMRPTAEIRVHAEAVAREFGTRADFADDLDHAFILMGRARNRAQKGEWSGMFWYQGFAGWMLERVQTETRSRSSGQSIMEEEAFIDEARQALEKDRAFYRTRTVPPDWGGARMADHGAAKELHEGARAADQFKYLFADDSRQVLDFVFGDTGVNPEDIEMLETEARGRQGNMRGIRNIRIMKIRKIGDADTKTLFMKFYSAVRDADAASQEILSEVAYHRAITGHFGADAPVIRAMAINDLKSQWASENGIHSLEIQEMAPGGELNREAPFTRILWRQAALSLGRLHQHVFDRDLFVRVGGRRGGPNLAIKRAHVFVDDTPNQERVTFIDLGHALPADTANARHIEVEEELFLDLFEDMFGQGLVDRGEYPDIRSARLDFESEYKRGLADRAEGARMAAVASRGKYGDEENQDSFLQIDLGEGWNVLAVFDGVGGSEKGAQASQAARDGVKDYFDDADVRELLHGILTPKLEKSISPLSAVPTPHSEIPLILEDAIARAQEKVRGVKSGDKYSATTALIALVRSDWDVAGNSAAWTINYGDCQSAVWDPSRPDQLRLVGIANMEQGLSKKGQRRLKWNQNYLADLDDAQVISSIYDFEAAALEGTGHSHAEPEDRGRLLNHYRRLRGQGIHLPFTWKQAETWIYRRMTTAIENGQGSFVWPSGVNETRIPPGGVLMLYTDGIGDNLTRREIARVVERNFGASPAPSFRGDWRTPEMRLADDLIWAVHDPTYVIHPMPGKDGSKPEHYSADTRGTVDPRHKRDDATVVVIRNRPTAPPAAARMADHLGSGKMTRRSALAAIAAAVGLRPDRAPGSDAGGRVLSGWSGRVYLLDSGEIVPAGRTLTEGQARVLSADDASLNVSPIWDGECNLLLVRSRSLPGVMGVAHLANGDEARSRAAGFPQRFSRAEVEEQFDGLMGHLAAVGITPEDAKAQLIRYGPSHVENVVEGRPFMDVWKEVLTARLGAAPAEREVNPVPRTVGDQAADRHNVMRRMWSNLVRRDDESFEIRSYADAGVLDSYGNEITLVSSQPVLRAEVTPDGLTDKPLISIQEEIWELIAAGATGLTGILLGGYGLSLPVRLLRSRVPINRPNLIGLVRSDLKSLRGSFRSPGSGEGMDRSAARMAAWVDRAIPVVWSNELRQAIRQNSADVHAAASDIIRQLGSMVIENNIRDMNVDAYVKALERGFGNALRARIADITDFESRIIGFYRFMMSSDTSSGYLNGYSLREAQDFRAILAEVLQHEWTQESDEDALEDEVVSYAADVFSRIVSLQAFENGNHRIGDFVMNFILAKNGFPTFVLTTSNVVEYYRLFNTSALRGKTPADVSGRVSFIRREIRNHTPARIHTARTATLKDGARMAEDDPDTVSETRKLFGQGTRKINKASEDASGDDLRIAGFTDLEHAFLRHQTTAEERHEILEYLLSHLRPPLTTGKADTHAAVQNKDLAESVLHHVLQQMPHQIRIQEFTD
ncbi:MAG: hypothetical protein KBD07_03675, partial [Candidatus Omnitrophica bacterium]|nr:hypothetical protein [Candidatus Omnitrophota bacterium]